MGQLKPLVIAETDVASDCWDDPVKGVLRFRTLFSGGATTTQTLTAGIADLSAGDWLGLHRHTPAEIYYVVEGKGLSPSTASTTPCPPGRPSTSRATQSTESATPGRHR
jgi:gentisate 1,2-dioxygenase